MTTKTPIWKGCPRSFRDEELIRFVMGDLVSTPLERELATRLERLLYHCDEVEEDAKSAPVQLRLF